MVARGTPLVVPAIVVLVVPPDVVAPVVVPPAAVGVDGTSVVVDVKPELLSCSSCVVVVLWMLLDVGPVVVWLPVVVPYPLVELVPA